MLLLWILFVLCVSCLSTILSCLLTIPCSLVVTCWERADHLVLLYVRFSCVFVIFPYGVLGQVWHLIVLIPDLCLLANIEINSLKNIVGKKVVNDFQLI